MEWVKLIKPGDKLRVIDSYDPFYVQNGETVIVMDYIRAYGLDWFTICYKNKTNMTWKADRLEILYENLTLEQIVDSI